MRHPRLLPLALCAAIVGAPSAVAAPKIVGTTPVQKDYSVEYGLAAAPGGGVYAPQTASRFLFGGGGQTKLLVLSKTGAVTRKLGLPVRNTSISGLGLGFGRKLWISAYTSTNGYIFRLGSRGFQKTRFSDQRSFQDLAVVNGTAYGSTVFSNLFLTHDGTTWEFQQLGVPLASRSVAAGAGGRLWIAGEGGIGHLDPGGAVTVDYAPASDVTVWQVVAASDGVWFWQNQGGSGASPRIGRLPLGGGTPTFFASARVRDMAIGPDGRPWLALNGGRVARVGRDGTLTKVRLPRHYELSAIAASGPNIWASAVQPYGAPAAGKSIIVRIRP